MQLLRILIWVIRIYIAVVILWALSTWMPFLRPLTAGWIDVLVSPILKYLGWMRFGFVGLGSAVVVIALLFIHDLLVKQLDQLAASGKPHSAPRPDGDSDKDTGEEGESQPGGQSDAGIKGS